MQRKWGWIPDLPDGRDFSFKREFPGRKVPDKVDLRPLCSPVEDQGNLGSCTANAGVGVYETLEAKQGMKPFEDKSRLFLYYNTRSLEGTTGQDSGASIRDTIRAMARWGLCSESIWPYDICRFDKKPASKCYAEAKKHLIVAYQRLYTLDEMLGCLADGFPFEFGFSVYESFESDQVARTGLVPMPKRGESLLGGHAVVGVGYDQATERLIVRNSWGVGWGDKGYFYLPFAYASNRNLSDDFWKVSKES